MLKLKVFVNDEQIDEIGIVNTGHIENGKHLYRFRIPNDMNHVEIYHNRNEHWAILVEKALSLYNKQLSKND